jgi:CheY-like chemotaxis protein
MSTANQDKEVSFACICRYWKEAVAEGAPKKTPAPSLAEVRGTETILLSEDHESIREMARQTLMNLGYRVLAACDGEEALRLCSHEVPALAILDVVMPKLGGPATAAKLGEQFDKLPVLFTSGFSQDSELAAPSKVSALYLQNPTARRRWEDLFARSWTRKPSDTPPAA